MLVNNNNNPAQTQYFYFQMPPAAAYVGYIYFISISSHDGEVSYYSRRQLSGFLLVKTDKPSQKGWLAGLVGWTGILDGCPS